MEPIVLIHALLRASAKMLDQAASEISDASLDPDRNVRRIGEMLCQVFELEEQLFGGEWEFSMDYGSVSPADRDQRAAFAVALVKGNRSFDAGLDADARSVWSAYLSTDPPAPFKAVIEAQLRRIERRRAHRDGEQGGEG
jgi:hypothetical protein